MNTGYTRAQIALHWVVAVLIAAQYLLADGIEEAWESYEEAGVKVTTGGAWLHIIIGVAVLGLALWRGARRFGPAKADSADTPEQSKLAAIATNARLLRIAGHDARMAADLVQANLADLAQTTFGRAVGAGPQGIARLFAHLSRRDPAAADELQAVATRLTDTASPPSPAELHRQLDAFRRLLETLTHGK